MGWTEIIPSTHKIHEVIFNTVDDSYGKVDNKTKVIGRAMKNLSKEGRETSFQEFRCALALELPKLDLNKSNFDEQLKVDPLVYKNVCSLLNFSKNEKIQQVDILNQSYALKVSVTNPKSKTGLVHYENARNRLLASTANQSLIDGEGNIYKNFSELPKVAQEYFRKKYRHSQKKRKANENQEETPDIEMTESTKVVQSETSAPANKKQRMSKLEAAKARASASSSRTTRSKTVL
jgi:hypothetical protein